MADASSPGAAQPTPGAGAVRVLVAVADTATRELLAFVVDRTPGLRVAGEAVNGAAAVEIAARLRPDVILLDSQLPGLVLNQTLPELQARCAEAQTVVMVPERSELDAAACFALGAAGYLTRTAELSEVIAAIHGAHRGEPFIGRAQ